MTMDAQRMKEFAPEIEDAAYWQDRALAAEKRIQELIGKIDAQRPRRSRRRDLFRLLAGEV